MFAWPYYYFFFIEMCEFWSGCSFINSELKAHADSEKFWLIQFNEFIAKVLNFVECCPCPRAGKSSMYVDLDAFVACRASLWLLVS